MTRHPWRALQPLTRRRLLMRTGAIFVALTIAMTRMGAPLKTETSPLGIVSFELAGTPERAQRLLGEWSPAQKEIAAKNIRLDYTYIVVYALAFSLACAAVADAAGDRRVVLQRAAALASWGALVAAILDVIENLAMMSELGAGASGAAPGVAFAAASLKFLLLGAAVAVLLTGGVRYWQSRSDGQ